MSELKHTPGPWHYKPTGDTGELIAPAVIFLDNNGACGDPECCGPVEYCISVKSADARLIAAAPELLAELARAIEHEYNPFEPDNQSARYKRMTALYAKATGAA